jgi:predicted O-methyltransferase YrrM
MTRARLSAGEQAGSTFRCHAVPERSNPMDEQIVHVTTIDSTPRSRLADAVRSAFNDALTGKGQMDERVYQVNGFCGRKHRLLLNNLVRALESPRYLEIGIFHGATLCAAVSNNKVKVVGVDNWSEYDGKASNFYLNLASLRGDTGAPVSIIEQDFRTINYAALGPFDVGFYDGPHSEQDQYDGASIIVEALTSPGILVVDDWNWQRVRNGTMNAIRDLGGKVECAIEVRTSFDDSIPSHAFAGSDWHNGVFVGVISK